MHHEEHRRQRHSRIRRAKAFLRYMPRRAVFHRYPLIGRFAAAARSRPYLWSFRANSLTRAFYVGSVLSLLPVMGVQLPLAFVLAVTLRTNLMVMGGLQFITNPASAPVVYATTYYVGRTIINATGFGASVPVDEEAAVDPGTGAEPGQVPEEAHRSLAWSSRLGNVVNALVLGGVVCGLALGAALDIAARLVRGRIPLRRPPPPPDASDSTPPPPGAQ